MHADVPIISALTVPIFVVSKTGVFGSTIICSADGCSERNTQDWTSGIMRPLCQTSVYSFSVNSYSRHSSRVKSTLRSCCSLCRCMLNAKVQVQLLCGGLHVNSLFGIDSTIWIKLSVPLITNKSPLLETSYLQVYQGFSISRIHLNNSDNSFSLQTG